MLEILNSDLPQFSQIIKFRDIFFNSLIIFSHNHSVKAFCYGHNQIIFCSFLVLCLRNSYHFQY